MPGDDGPRRQIGFDEIDTNRDGAIDFEEFTAWWNERA